jgi:hypothetical protein
LRPQTSASHRRRRVRLRALPPPSRVALRRRGPPAAAWSAGSGDLLATDLGHVLRAGMDEAEPTANRSFAASLTPRV